MHSSHLSHDGGFTLSWDQESLSSHWIEICYRNHRVTQRVAWQTRGQNHISRFPAKCFFCHIVLTSKHRPQLSEGRWFTELTGASREQGRLLSLAAWPGEAASGRENSALVWQQKKEQQKNLNLSSGWNYSSLPWLEVLLYMVSVTCC